MALDSFDRELLRRMDLHGYYSPNSVDERLRLVKLAELGLVQSKLQSHNDAARGQPPPRYRLTELGKKQLYEGEACACRYARPGAPSRWRLTFFLLRSSCRVWISWILPSSLYWLQELLGDRKVSVHLRIMLLGLRGGPKV